MRGIKGFPWNRKNSEEVKSMRDLFPTEEQYRNTPEYIRMPREQIEEKKQAFTSPQKLEYGNFGDLPDDDPSTRNGGLIPSRREDHAQIQMYMQQRQAGMLSDKAWQRLMQRNPQSATLFASVMPEQKKGGKAFAGGVQYGIDEKGNTRLFSFHPETGDPVELSAPSGVTPTMPMQGVQVMGPGGVSQIVQMPGRGVPGRPPVTSPTGLIPKNELTPEQGGRLAMLDQASADVDDAMSIMFKNGKFDKDLALNIAASRKVGFAGIGGDARKVYSAIRNAIGGKLRAETGAAAPDKEVDEIMDRFFPTNFDNDDSARYKLQRLKEYVEGTYKLVDPSGSYVRPTQKRRDESSADDEYSRLRKKHLGK